MAPPEDHKQPPKAPVSEVVTKEEVVDEEEVNLMQPPPRIKKGKKKGKGKKGPAADALAQLEKLEVEEDKGEVRSYRPGQAGFLAIA